MDIKDLYSKFQSCNGITTDTRKLSKNTMFAALKGERFDGNKFVEQAFNLGAKYCIVDDKKAVINKQCVLVNDSLFALQKLSNFHRNQIKTPIIALTGSNGKTTTKELITNVLSSKYKVKSTVGNFNNHIGVPLTLLSFDETLDFGIVEMGANHQKEINFLCEIAEPNYGLITNFGKAHLEGFGGVEGVIKGKSEMYDYLRANNKTIFVNTKDQKQIEQIKNYEKIITFGNTETNDCVVTFLEANPFVGLEYRNTKINSQLIGSYNFGNIAVSVAIGHYFGLDSDQIKKAIESYIPKNNRSEIKKIKSNTIIMDAYNANPSSMLVALENFHRLDAKNKIVIVGDMLELGDDSKHEHQEIINVIENYFPNNVITVGKYFYATQSQNYIKKYPNFESLIEEYEFRKLENKTLFLKGSRGIALERILKEME